MKIDGVKVLRLTTGAATMALALTACGSRGPVANLADAGANAGTPSTMLVRQSDDARAAGNAEAAISFAELAVTADPQSFDARVALAKAYLAAGRFHSASEAYGDMAAMRPDDNGAKFRVALAELGKGNRNTALASLEVLAGRPELAADVGLAFALAGEADRAVALLERVVRAGESTARIRQNLALAQALSGEWAAARTTASIDLAPNEIDGRVAEWAQLASSRDPAWRTATVLGVDVAETDAGRPVQLAWSPTAGPVQFAAAEDAPAAEAAVPPAAPSVEVAAIEPAIIAPAPLPVQQVAARRADPVAIASAEVPPPAVAKPVVFEGLKSAEVTPAEKLPTKKAIVTDAGAKPLVAVKRTIRALPKPTVGTWVVQVGAYAKPEFATVGWKGLVSKNKALGEFKPLKSSVEISGSTYHRLSVGTFATLEEAKEFCGGLKDAGQKCFVRKGEGSVAQPQTPSKRA